MLYILDADGTLTAQRGGSAGPFEQTLLPGVAQKCAALREQGHVLSLASNQGGARWDKDGRRTIGAVHAQLRWTARAIGAVAYKFAVNKANGRYKPSPAMLIELMRELGFDADETIFIGDQETDRQAAEAACVRFIWADKFFGGIE